MSDTPSDDTQADFGPSYAEYVARLREDPAARARMDAITEQITRAIAEGRLDAEELGVRERGAGRTYPDPPDDTPWEVTRPIEGPEQRSRRRPAL